LYLIYVLIKEGCPVRHYGIAHVTGRLLSRRVRVRFSVWRLWISNGCTC